MSDPHAPQDPSGQTPDGQAPAGPPPEAQPPAYGAPPPPPPGYAAPAYGAPQVPTPYAAQSMFGSYASWGQRAVATLWDFVYLWPGLIPLSLGYVLLFAGAAASSDGSGGGALVALGMLLILVGIALVIWRTISNYMLDQGRSGYTYGKRKLGIRTIREQDGQASGVGSCVARYFLHAIINQACYIDYLWPLWDQPKRQTLTDKILTTVVVNQPAPT